MAVTKFYIDAGAAKASVDKALAGIKEKIPQAMTAAINRTADEGRTAVVKALSQEVTLKVSSIREVVKVRKISKADYLSGKSAYIVIKDSLRPLFDFPWTKVRAGIRVRVRKGKAPELKKNAFVAGVTTGHTGTAHKAIFWRMKGRDKAGRLTKRGYARRLPIKELWGPSLVNVFEKAGTIAADALKNIRDVLLKNANSQISRFTKPKG